MDQFFGSWALYLSYGSCQAVKIKQYCTSDISKKILLILSHWSDSVQVGEVHIFKHRLYISGLEQARLLILGKYVLLGVSNTIYKHCHT